MGGGFRAARRVDWTLFVREKWRGTDGGFGGGWCGLRGPGIPFSRRRQVAVGGDARRRPVAMKRERENKRTQGEKTEAEVARNRRQQGAIGGFEYWPPLRAV